MKNLLILALLSAFACCEDTPKYQNQCFKLISISDANPVQFWQNDCETWNESTPEGMHHYCFCQPFQCDDEIKLQFSDIDDTDYALLIENSDGDQLSLMPFLRETLIPVPPMQDLGDWINGDDAGTEIWNVVGSPSLGAMVTSENSKYLKGDFESVVGIDYSFTYNFTLDVPGGSNAIAFTVYLLDADENVLDSQVSSPYTTDGVKTATVSLSPSANGAYIAVKARVVLGDMNSLVMNSFTNDSVPGLSPTRTISFTPSDLGICDEQIILKIVNTDTTPNSTVYKSDCLSIKTTHRETVLINYSNHRNFAGLEYSDTSPDPSYNLRIPAVFNEQRLPQEGEDLQLSSNRMIQLNAQTKVQNLLYTGRMPNYMHLKMVLVLQHQFLYIKGQYWVKGSEVYERIDGNRRDPFRKYNIWLTMKDYVARNIL